MTTARKRRRIGVRTPKQPGKAQPRTDVLVRLVPGKKMKPV
jgi:hypothetical protein